MTSFIEEYVIVYILLFPVVAPLFWYLAYCVDHLIKAFKNPQERDNIERSR
jgi:hypothetical protein